MLPAGAHLVVVVIIRVLTLQLDHLHLDDPVLLLGGHQPSIRVHLRRPQLLGGDAGTGEGAACCNCPEPTDTPCSLPGTPLPPCLPALLLPLGQDLLVLGVKLGHMAGHTAKETRWGSGGSAPHTRAILRGGTPPSCFVGLLQSYPGTQASCYLRFSWPLADGLKKRVGSKEGDMGPKCMARGCGELLMLGDMGRKGVGDAYLVPWRGREKRSHI